MGSDESACVFQLQIPSFHEDSQLVWDTLKSRTTVLHCNSSNSHNSQGLASTQGCLPVPFPALNDRLRLNEVPSLGLAGVVGAESL